MPIRRNTLFGGAILLTISVLAFKEGAGCVDAGQSFKAYDDRVIDAAMTNVGGDCNGGEIPDVNGEFLLALSPSFAPEGLLQFRTEVTIDKSVSPALLTQSLQPLCAQESQCTLGEPVGDPFAIENVEVDDQCGYTANLVDVFIPGAANPVSGSDIIGNIELLGSLQSTDLLCGIANGTAEVSGAPIPIDNSTFGGVRIEGELPEPVAACPDEGGPDAGVPDGGQPVDAGMPDGM